MRRQKIENVSEQWREKGKGEREEGEGGGGGGIGGERDGRKSKQQLSDTRHGYHPSFYKVNRNLSVIITSSYCVCAVYGKVTELAIIQSKESWNFNLLPIYLSDCEGSRIREIKSQIPGSGVMHTYTYLFPPSIILHMPPYYISYSRYAPPSPYFMSLHISPHL